MSEKIDPDKLENFERAFSAGTGGCRRTCDCGREFYNGDGGWTWDEGELEALAKNANATPLPYTVGDISFEGKEYVNACDCWHKRAAMIMGFLDGHSHKIADYLSLEKKRLQRIAENAPTVEGHQE